LEERHEVEVGDAEFVEVGDMVGEAAEWGGGSGQWVSIQ